LPGVVVQKKISTGAAEIAVPNKEDMYQDFHTSLERALQAMQTRIQLLKKQLHAFQERPVLVTPLAMYTLQKENLKNFQSRLQQAIKTLLQNQQAKANQFRASLNALSPFAVIDRGYALTTLANGEVVHSLKEVNIGDLITTQLKDGTFTSEVKKKG